nr:cytochrome P450 [Paris polyphylla]
MLLRWTGEVRHHLNMNWIGRQTVTVLPLMKRLTFDIISSLIFGLEKGPIRERLGSHFQEMIEGMWAVPVNLPLTRFNKSLKASRKAREVIVEIIDQKKAALKNGSCGQYDDLITYLLSLSVDKETTMTEEEIIDNAVLVMVAGHDTSSILMTFMVRRLAKDHATLAAVVHEQEEISRAKAPEEPLMWDDLTKMKYTWRVAMETLRMIPPVFGSFRRALKDLEFGGYFIPKGWQVFWASSITQMDANLFHDPQVFEPMRFESQSSVPPYCFVAFGGGPRICPGNDFARIEVLVTMHHLVTQFRWKLCCKDDGFCRDPLPSPSQGLPIQLELKADPLAACSILEFKQVNCVMGFFLRTFKIISEESRFVVSSFLWCY